jgi:hypothetical protein
MRLTIHVIVNFTNLSLPLRSTNGVRVVRTPVALKLEPPTRQAPVSFIGLQESGGGGGRMLGSTRVSGSHVW